jgi:hypothetical protein
VLCINWIQDDLLDLRISCKQDFGPAETIEDLERKCGRINGDGDDREVPAFIVWTLTSVWTQHSGSVRLEEIGRGRDSEFRDTFDIWGGGTSRVCLCRSSRRRKGGLERCDAD